MPSAFQVFTQLTQPSLTSAGTGQRVISTDLYCRSAVIQALKTNSGFVYLGDSVANSAAGKGHALAPGESLPIGGDNFHQGRSVEFNLKNIYFDGDTTGNKLNIHYLADVPR